MAIRTNLKGFKEAARRRKARKAAGIVGNDVDFIDVRRAKELLLCQQYSVRQIAERLHCRIWPIIVVKRELVKLGFDVHVIKLPRGRQCYESND